MVTSHKTIINQIVSALVEKAKKDEGTRKELAERMAKMMDNDPQFREALFKAVFSNKDLGERVGDHMLQELLD